MTIARYLLVGDPHVVVDELADCQRLADYVLAILDEVDDPAVEVVFLGDLYNNHAVVRVEVIAFWNRFFRRLEERGTFAHALVGNHDRPQSGVQGNVHSLMANLGNEGLRVVSEPEVFGGIGWIPYMPTPEAWVKAFRDLGSPGVVLCHQTFAGSRYENGFFAPDGVSTEVLCSTKVISGHIHSPQNVGNVWYPGAPRWRSISDANTDRHLHLIEMTPLDGWKTTYSGYESLRSFPTDKVCTPIRLKTITSKSELEGLRNEPGLRVTVQGDESYVREAEAVLKSHGIKFRSQVTGTDHSKGQIRESDGIQVAFDRHLEAFKAPNGTSIEILKQLVATRLRR